MTNCLAVVAGNFDQVGDKPPCNASNSVPTDKKWTGCSLAASKTMGYIAKGLLYGPAMNGGRYH